MTHDMTPFVILITKESLWNIKNQSQSQLPEELRSIYGIPFESFNTDEEIKERLTELRMCGKCVAVMSDDGSIGTYGPLMQIRRAGSDPMMDGDDPGGWRWK
jgi:hypothetical protein